MDIQVLPQDLVNQIAAGEVVERPAHMIKELVENSVDAEAKEIEIEFAQGGKYLVIKDDGIGIKKDQLAVALARHATSKINKIDDLWQLSSFGFRGEALSSISAVSDFTMTSRNIKSEQAYSLNCSFGKISPVEEAGGEQGTQIIIKDLFKNVPARLKFLKTDGYESTQIKQVLKALAMSHYKVSFRVKMAGELIYYWPSAESRKKRIEDILEIGPLHSVSGEYEGANVEIIYSSPNKTVKSRKQIWSFVQNRWVMDKTISAAIVDAYRSLLMHGEYPYAAAFVDMDSEEIDVNIHPTKSQVKYRNSSNIYKLVYRSLRNHIETAPWLESLLPDKKVEDDLTEYSVKITPKPIKEETLSFKDDSFAQVQFPQKKIEVPLVNNTLDQIKTLNIDSDEVLDVPIGEASEVKSITSAFDEKSTKSAVESEPIESRQRWSHLQVLGQLNLTYIITQKNNSLVLVDQHAAHERVVFEKLMLAFEEQNFEVQNLLLPQVINMNEEHVKILVEHKEDISKLGIDIDAMGDDAIAIRSLPSLIKEKSLKSALEKMASQIEEKGGSVELKTMVSDVFATMACHSVVRAGQSLSQEEMTSLLQQMDEFPLSSFCPHGRPVFVERSFNQIEKDFGRIV